MTDKNREELKAFAQKMHDEGTAGFAAGLTPWDSWDDFEERVGSRVWQGTAEHVAEPEDPARSFGDRVLTTMTALAVATLVIGIAGVFLTQQPAIQLAENNPQFPSTSPAITTELQLPREEDIALNDVLISATETPASPAADIIMKIRMAAGPRDGNPALPAILVEGNNIFTALNEQPAPAAGSAHKSSTVTTPSEPAVEALAHEQAGIPDTNTAEPENNTPVQPIRLSDASMLDVHTKLQRAPTRDINQKKQTGNNGDWSINIASYLRDSTAEKMRQRFLDNGVATTLVTATVNGKTYYRLRVTGFESKQTATAQSIIIKKKLDLEEVWITKK